MKIIKFRDMLPLGFKLKLKNDIYVCVYMYMYI